MSEGFGFLGFRIQWRRKKGTSKWYVYTFIDDRPIRSLKAKIRALTRRTSQQDLAYVLTRLNQVMHGWANYFRHAVAKHTFAMLDNFTWWRVIRMLMERHRWKWKDVRRRLTTPPGGGCRSRRAGSSCGAIAAIPVTRYRYRGTKIPSPWAAATSLTAGTVESPLRREAHGGFGERSGETDREQSRHRAPGLLIHRDEPIISAVFRIGERRPVHDGNDRSGRSSALWLSPGSQQDVPSSAAPPPAP